MLGISGGQLFNVKFQDDSQFMDCIELVSCLMLNFKMTVNSWTASNCDNRRAGKLKINKAKVCTSKWFTMLIKYFI